MTGDTSGPVCALVRREFVGPMEETDTGVSGTYDADRNPGGGRTARLRKAAGRWWPWAVFAWTPLVEWDVEWDWVRGAEPQRWGLYTIGRNVGGG
jgi:hypothetical protein